MEKENFIEIIRLIYIEISKTDSRFEISLEDLDNINDHLDIIIPSSYSENRILEICDIISIENGRYSFQRNENALCMVFTEFKLNFIKTFDDLIKYRFLYNSFSVFKDLLTILFDKINLTYTENGLFYTQEEATILLSTDYNKILSFIGIDSKDIFKQGISYRELFYVIVSSSFFDTRYFDRLEIEKLDNYIKYKALYDNFLLVAISQKTYINFEFNSLYMFEIDIFFQNSNLLEKLAGSKINKHKDKFIKNKPESYIKKNNVSDIFTKFNTPPKKTKKFSIFNLAKNI